MWFAEVSAGSLVLAPSSSLLGPEAPRVEIKGDMGDQSMCSLPSGDSEAGLDGTGGLEGGLEVWSWSLEILGGLDGVGLVLMGISW